jgi:hypothetical protein
MQALAAVSNVQLEAVQAKRKEGAAGRTRVV